MNQEQLLFLLEILNDKLNHNNVKGEMIIYGEEVMYLAHDAGNVAVDTVWSPKREIKEYLKEIAAENNLKEDWLNASVAGIQPKSEDKKDFNQFLKLSNLSVYVASPEYMLILENLKKPNDHAKKA